MKSRVIRALCAFAGLFASACGGQDDEAFAGHDKSCIAVAGRFADLWLECGLITDRNAAIAEFGCNDVEAAPQERVDQCVARIEALTCATANSGPAECMRLFPPKAAESTTP